MVKVGKVTHYYTKIGVAVVEVEKTISIGDTIKISGHDQEFTQSVASMQQEHKAIQKAKKGMVIGLQVEKAVKAGDEVYQVDEGA